MEELEKKRLPLALAPGEGEEPNETVAPLAEPHPRTGTRIISAPALQRPI